MTDDVSTPFREKVAKQRSPFEADLMLRAVVVARAKHDAMAAEDIEGKTVADLTDEQALVNGFALFLEDWRGFVEMPALNRCGWCAEANGEDWDALPRMTLAEIREHTVACQHNPLVVENERLKQEDREAIGARNTLGAALMVADNEHSSSLVDCANRAAALVMEYVRLRAEVEAMRPVVDAAVGYCMSPSGCHRSEARLVEAAGLYHANRRMLENASVLEANVVRTSRFTMGAECSACGHRHAGPDVGHICIGCPCEERPVDTAERK